MNDCSHQKFYDRKWSEAARLNELPIHDGERVATIINLVKRWIPPIQRKRPIRIIDIGCGVGWISQRLLSFGQVIGIDSSQAAIEIARTRYPEVQFSCIDVLDNEEIPQLGLFDLAIASEVIEHIPDERRPEFASKLSLLARPGGILIVTTPNRLVWKYWWQEPKSQKWKQPVEDWCSPTELSSILANYFECLEISTFNFAFSKKGIYRILSNNLFKSRKLNSLARRLRMSGRLYEFKARKYGLIIAAAYRRY